jgi:hypothetical protein
MTAQLDAIKRQVEASMGIPSASEKSSVPVETNALPTGGSPVVTNSTGTFGEDDILSNVSYMADTTDGDQLVLVLQNNNNVSIPYMEVDLVFYAQDGSMITSTSNYAYSFLPGAYVALNFYLPYDDDYNLIPYASYDILCNPTMDPSYLYNNAPEKVDIQSNTGTDGVVAMVTNTSSATMNSIELACVFFRGDDIVGYTWNSANDLASGASTSLQFYYPYDMDYNDVQFDSYTIFVNSALSY